MTYKGFLKILLALGVMTGLREVAGANEQQQDDQSRVTATMRAMYAAATRDDMAGFHEVAAPGFYAFDAGKKFTGDELMQLIKTLHASGKTFVWTVNEPDVHVTGDIAWITYTNRGSIDDGSGRKEMTWLESAILRKQADKWRIEFFHSTRAASE